MSLFGLSASEHRAVLATEEHVYELLASGSRVCQCHDCFTKRKESEDREYRRREVQRKLDKRVLPDDIICQFITTGKQMYKVERRAYPPESVMRFSLPVKARVTVEGTLVPDIWASSYRTFYRRYYTYDDDLNPTTAVYEELE